jgi:hypothetical protein
MEIVRYDVIEEHAKAFSPEGVLACRWVQPYKPRKQGENSERALKLTAENLFVALADPTTEPTPENTRLVQFLALMLERKKILRPRGRSTDGARNRFEHARSKQIFEIPAGDLTPEFFVAVQQQLSVLVGGPKTKPGAATSPVELPVTDAEAPPSATGLTTPAASAAAISAVTAVAAMSGAAPMAATPTGDFTEPNSVDDSSLLTSESDADTSKIASDVDSIAPPAAPIKSEGGIGSEVEIEAAIPAAAEPETDEAAAPEATESTGHDLDGELQTDAVFEGDADAGVESQSEPEVADAPPGSAFPAADAVEAPSDEEKPAPGSTGGSSGGTAAA